MTGEGKIIKHIAEANTLNQVGDEATVYTFSTDTLGKPVIDSCIQSVRESFFNTGFSPGLKETAMPHFLPVWIPILLVSILALVALIRFVYAKKLRIVLQAPFSSRHLQMLKRGSESITLAMSMYLMLIYYLSFSFLIFLFVDMLFPEVVRGISSHVLFGIIFISLILLSRIKYGLIAFWGYLFKTKEYAYKYRFYITLFSTFQGIIISPLIILAVYGPQNLSVLFLLSAGIILLILYFVRVTRGLIATLGQSKFFIIYFFLYLCTLEILPILFLVKLLILEDKWRILNIL